MLHSSANPRGGNPAMPHHGFKDGPIPPVHAAEGIVKGRWIMEISRVFFRSLRCDYIYNIIIAYI